MITHDSVQSMRKLGSIHDPPLPTCDGCLDGQHLWALLSVPWLGCTAIHLKVGRMWLYEAVPPRTTTLPRDIQTSSEDAEDYAAVLASRAKVCVFMCVCIAWYLPATRSSCAVSFIIMSYIVGLGIGWIFFVVGCLLIGPLCVTRCTTEAFLGHVHALCIALESPLPWV